MSVFTTPSWAAGVDIHDEGTPDEWRCHWTLPVTVHGVQHPEHRGALTAQVLAEQSTDPEFVGPFVVLDIETDSSRRAMFTPAVARRLALQLLHHAEMLTEETER